MKRLAILTVAALLLLAGCAPDKPTTEPPVTSPETGQTGEQQPVQEISKVKLNEKFLGELATNEIQGFPIAIGASKDEIMKKYGAVTETNFYEGGEYHAFEKLDQALLFFDGKERLYAIDIGSKYLSTTDSQNLKKAVGKPDYDGMDDSTGGYTITYQAGDNSVFISAADDKSPVEKIRIINKKMIEEAPQEL
ncbi:hypothetical protein [Brevibacillus daliensis]|uniref:hypothetical protein n=1 Tax=Brevibacillus daliensis TaxID=2892995 RepID=UPI001E5669E2|nr:hypothetical protein [Brevibacillus daliensis]